MTPEEARAWLVGYERAQEELARERRSVNGPLNAGDLDPRHGTGERRGQ